MVFRLVWVCADCTLRGIAAQCSWVAISLALPTLGASAIGDVFFKLALSVADDKVLTTDISFLNITGKCHNNR